MTAAPPAERPAPVPFVPRTVREVMAAFAPLCAWHTVRSVDLGVRALTLTCVCGGRRTVLQDDVESRGWSWDAIKTLLRIVPATVLPASSKEKP